MSILLLFTLSILLLSFGLFLAYFYRVGRIGASTVGALFFIYILFSITYFFADRLSGDGFNESVIYHLEAGITGVGIGDFLPMLLMFIVLCVVAIISSYIVYRFLSHRLPKQKNPGWAFTLSILFLVVSVLAHPLSLNLTSLSSTNNKSAFATYFVPPILKGKHDNPPNIVYIYLESLERTYLDETLFPGLTPELKRLEKSAISFVNIDQVWGTGWTIAGMVASQCGIPLVTTGSSGNSMDGMNSFLPHANCLGDSLADRGYTLSYNGGASLRFAGKGKFYTTHGFVNVQGREEQKGRLDDQSYMNSWGLYDDTLFDLAWENFISLAEKDKPFGLFLLTIDTHHPNGYPSASCINAIDRYPDNSMLAAVACSDYLVGNFVNKILSTEYANNTVIVISSDHLAMTNKVSKLLDKGKRKNLFMVLKKESIEPKKIEKAGTMLDVTPTLLGIMGYDDLKFGLGRNLLSGAPSLVEKLVDIDETLKGFTTDLRRFWQFPILEEKILINLENKFLETGGEKLTLPVLLKIRQPIEITMTPEIEIEEIYFEGIWDIVLKNNLNAFLEDDFFIWIDKCEVIQLIAPNAKDDSNSVFCIFAGQMGRKDNFYLELTTSMEVMFSKIMTFTDGPFEPQLFRSQKHALRTGMKLNQIIKKSIEVLKFKSLAMSENTPESYLNLSLQFYNIGQYELSIEAAETALNLKPQNAPAFNNICVSLIMLEHFERAIENCQQAIVLDSNYSLAKNNLRWAITEQAMNTMGYN